MSIYLDYNASTPVDQEVLEAMFDVYRNNFGNADSRTHNEGNSAKQIVEKSREDVAGMLGVDKSEVFFTSGATESNNIAILGLYDYGIKKNKKHIITTAIEHKAVLEPCSEMIKKGFEVEIIQPNSSGAVEYSEVISKVRRDTLLVSVMHVNNETGIIQPVDEIGEALAAKEVLFHVDAAQSCGKLVEELKNIKYDMLSITAHKMYGPQGIGGLILRHKKGVRSSISPICFGGGQEGRIRPGTLPVPLICGFGKACELATKNYKKNKEIYQEVRNNIFNILQDENVEFLINGNSKKSIPNTMNISFLGVDSEALMLASKQYCSLSNGSACTSHDYSQSHVLKAMNLTSDRIESAIRFSWGNEVINYEMIRQLGKIIKEFI